MKKFVLRAAALLLIIIQNMILVVVLIHAINVLHCVLRALILQIVILAMKVGFLFH